LKFSLDFFMRLTTSQQKLLKEAIFEVCGEDAQVFLFGSRLDDNKKGGDIDLIIKLNQDVTNPAWIVAKVQAKVMIKLGEQKIDVLIDAPNLTRLPIHDIALSQGVLL
jgi:predicted nucleotidyltransferase